MVFEKYVTNVSLKGRISKKNCVKLIVKSVGIGVK